MKQFAYILSLVEFATGAGLVTTALYMWKRRNGGQVYPALLQLLGALGAALMVDSMGLTFPFLRVWIKLFNVALVVAFASRLVVLIVRGK